MMGRMAAALTGTAAAVTPVLATSDKGATVGVSQPVIWHVLGYPYEAASMIAALFACGTVRFYMVGSAPGKHRWTLDAPVSLLALLFTSAVVIRVRPDPVFALTYGTGLGVLGAGIIALAKKHVDRALAALGLTGPPDEPTG